MKPKTCAACGCEMSIDDEGTPYHRGKHWAELDLTFCLKRQLEHAKNRIKRLEEAGDRLAMFTNTASDRVGAWIKAKEAA